jgi:hypothetical protein
MKPNLRKSVLALFTGLFVVLATGCETLHPTTMEMEPLENYGGGGGGGDDS